MTERRTADNKSECPLDQKSVNKLLGTLESIDTRLQKIEHFMLIGHVVVWTIGIMSVSFWWVIEHFEYIKTVLRDFLGVK